MGLIDCNAREGVGTGDREYRALRGHLRGQTPVDNVMNDLESVNFIQSKMPVHDPSSESFDWETIFESSDRCGETVARTYLFGQRRTSQFSYYNMCYYKIKKSLGLASFKCHLK